MTNYFMIYRPFHLDYARKIISCHCLNDRNVLVNHFPSREYSSDENGVRNPFYANQGGLSKLLELRKIKKELKRLAQQGEPVSVFIPHTLGILSNYVFYRLASRYKNVKLNIFYEGVIVFYTYQHHYLKNMAYYMSRFALSFAIGFVYRIDKTLLNLQDPRIHKIYTPFMQLEAPREKLVETPLEKIEYAPLLDTAVVLGSVLDEKFNEDMRKIIRCMYVTLEKLDIQKIYFKDHPVYKNGLFQSIAKEMGKELILIHDTSPIEKIIMRYSPKYIISIWSSGIVNLSVMLPASTKMYCFVTERLIKTETAKKLLNAFKRQDIEIIYA